MGAKVELRELTFTVPEVEALYKLAQAHEDALGNSYVEIVRKLAFVLVERNWDPSKSKDSRCVGCMLSCSACSILHVEVAAFIAEGR